jgi:tetratricopeptide (TPR) repeat protein
MTPEDLVDASLDDFNSGNFSQCIHDATQSLKLRPGMPAAWNNIVLCNGYLGQWEEAVQAAEEGVRLEPEVAEARDNLEWARSEGRH